MGDGIWGGGWFNWSCHTWWQFCMLAHPCYNCIMGNIIFLLFLINVFYVPHRVEYELFVLCYQDKTWYCPPLCVLWNLMTKVVRGVLLKKSMTPQTSWLLTTMHQTKANISRILPVFIVCVMWHLLWVPIIEGVGTQSEIYRLESRGQVVVWPN